MSAQYNIYDLGELSRRKLRKVAESSDTLRRAVLIHNIMRSTASLPPSPTLPDCNYDYYPHCTTPEHHHTANEPQYVEEPTEEEEQAYREAAAAAAQATSTQESGDLFVFPSSTAQEHDWFNSVFDDLEGDVQVVPMDEYDEDEALDDDTPLFPAAQCTPAPPSSSPHQSPPLRPTSPRCLIPYTSPPTSPPGLDVHTIDSDDEDSDDDDFNAVATPSASTELTPADTYFFNHLPYHNHSTRPHCRPLH